MLLEADICENDLLLYRIGAYAGRTNICLLETQVLAGNHVNILCLASGLDAVYMALLFQSVASQFHTQRHARGNAQAELYPAGIGRLVVPLLRTKKQGQIGGLRRESLSKQQESKRLLTQAKQRVEELIQQAIE